MRLIRSESCTFIWQPKVLMQAVRPSEGARASGLRESGIVCVVSVVLLILILRLVDAGPHGDLPRTALDPEVLDLQIPGTRRPLDYIRDATTFLLPKRKHRPSNTRNPPTPRP